MSTEPVIVDVEAPHVGSSPRRDLAALPFVARHRPSLYEGKGRRRQLMGYGTSFQQYDGTDLCQWHINHDSCYWRGVGPVFRLVPSTPSTSAAPGSGEVTG